VAPDWLRLLHVLITPRPLAGETPRPTGTSLLGFRSAATLPREPPTRNDQKLLHVEGGGLDGLANPFFFFDGGP